MVGKTAERPDRVRVTADIGPAWVAEIKALVLQVPAMRIDHIAADEFSVVAAIWTGWQFPAAMLLLAVLFVALLADMFPAEAAFDPTGQDAFLSA
jgi:membrane-associated PAP2 superfamily phosphatase